MMKLLLINPPNNLLDRTYLAPPLGLLTLAAVAQYHGYKVSVIDFNLEVLSKPSIGNSSFYKIACEMITEENADVIGFTSMCLESHVSLELARRIKATSPNTVMIFGGTHFGAIAKELLERFPFVDYVVTGEGEDAIVAILNKLSKGESSLPRNVEYRKGKKILSGTVEQTRLLFEELLFPAYGLVDLQRYFDLNPSHLLNYEAGRGCIFKCTFCYSPFQYGDAVRNKSPESVVKDLQKLSQLGARHIFFVQDNFLNSPRWASELCQQIADAKLPLTWECYSTYPQLKEPIIDLLAQAGCIGIFTGIDAVSPESQTRMNKPFLKNWETTSQKLAYCKEKGVLPICAFILEEPNQEVEKIEATIYTAIQCVNLGCEIHINTLSIYNKTALSILNPSRSLEYSSIKPELLLDTPEIVQQNDFAKQFPELFPYHISPCDVSEWERFSVKVYTLLALIIALRKTAYQYVVEEGSSIWETLGYVNDVVASQVREQQIISRRLFAILKFVEHFSRKSLSLQTTTFLHREIAQLLLASFNSSRFVSLRVENIVKSYRLAWFLVTSENFYCDISQEMLINSHLKGTGFKPMPFSVVSSKDYEIALRSQQNMIKIYAIQEERVRLLSQLVQASKTGDVLSIETEQILRLEQEGWLWAAN